MIVLLPKPQLKMFLADQSRRSGRFDSPREKQRLRIAVPEGLKRFMPPKKIEVQFRESNLVIEAQPRLQILIRQKFARDPAKFFLQKIDIRRANSEPGGHCVTAEFFETFCAATQCLHEIKSFDATTTPFPDAAFIKSDHKGRPVIFVR